MKVCNIIMPAGIELYFLATSMVAKQRYDNADESDKSFVMKHLALKLNEDRSFL